MTTKQGLQSSAHIVVVGSINMDLVATMDQLPRPGETVTGQTFQTIPGGKGANQAVAAARLGANTSMIGRLGDDPFAVSLRKGLNDAGIDTKSVFETIGCSSGVALIGVEISGANAITVIPAANGRLSASDVQSSESLIAASQALIVQLETPVATVCAAVEIARRLGVLTILDPAPVPTEDLPAELFCVDLISPNQTEAERLTGIVVDGWESAEQAARALQLRGANHVVLKMGSQGAFVLRKDGQTHRVGAPQAEVVDTTAAGDAFTAALTVALCEGQDLARATQFGCVAGTIACTRFGAQPAMPMRDELNQWLEQIQP